MSKNDKPVDLRRFAREWNSVCLIRIPGVCNYGPTCLCHYRVANVAGIGQKPPDLCGAIGCDSCHAIIDGRVRDRRFGKTDLESIMLHAIVRTLAAYHAQGFVLIEGVKP